MSTIWILLLVLAFLGGSAKARRCKTCLRDQGPNLAIGLPAFQSSPYPHVVPNGGAEKAVDGNCEGHWQLNSCTHTSEDMEPWWYVDMGNNHAISTVVVKNREDCCDKRLEGAQIRVGNFRGQHVKQNHLCGTIRETSLGSISIVSCQGLKGRFVSIHIPGRREYLTLCEVEIYGTDLEEQC